jgi:hypothetical protein
MSRADGFMIPLDLADWQGNGDRTNWCSKQVWWTNQNISLAGSSLGPTEVKVGETVQVEVGVQGVVPTTGDTELAIVQNVQAWACYPSPTAGRASASLVLPSMASSNPAFTSTQNLLPSNPIFNPGDYQRSAGGAFALITLAGAWTPTSDDLVAPNTDTHCCLIATSKGRARVDTPFEGPVGTFIPSDSDLGKKTGIDICTSPYQGQCNIAILPLMMSKRKAGLLVQEFGFLAAGLNAAPENIVVGIAEVEQANGVDPAVERALKGGPYRALSLTPATSGLKTLRLAKNTYNLTAALSKIVRPATKIVESGSSLTLSLPVEGIQPLLLQVEVDATSKLGSVYAFDITQTDVTGKRGGIRVGAIVVP